MFKLFLIFLLIFVANAEGKTLECSFSTFEDKYELGPHYGCEITSKPNITEFLDEDVQGLGAHASGKTYSDVTVFSCSQIHECQMFYFPRGLQKIFENLVAISLYKVGLVALYGEDLQKLDKLEVLWIPHNKIEVLEENLFMGTPKLRVLYLNSNPIKFIHTNAFENLNNLQSLYLTQNACIDENAKILAEIKRVIQSARDQCTSDVDLYKLHQESKPYKHRYVSKEELERKVQVLENKVQKLQDDVEYLMQMFYRIELNCQIDYYNSKICKLSDIDIIDEKIFIYDVKNLDNYEIKEVVMQNQNMHFVPKKFSQFFAEITKLSIKGSNFNKLESKELENLKNLEDLRVTNNKIGKIDFVLPWKKLIVLDLSSNTITSVTNGSFDNLNLLQELYLDSNLLTSLPAKIFDKLVNLRVFSMNINQLEVLTVDVIPCPNKIQTFSMTFNKLNKIDVKVVRCLKTADEINLSGNTCIDEHYMSDSSRFGLFAGSIVVSCTENDYES